MTNNNYNQPDVDSDQNLGETVTTLTAAVPYMAPSADLRGRILQATAPATFKMEDYRKATRDNSRFYRWSSIAATLFLVAGAWYNISMQSALKQSVANQQALANQLNAQNDAIAKIANPQASPVFIRQDNRIIAKAYVNSSDNTAVVFLPKSLVPAGKTLGSLTLADSHGKPVTYRAVSIPTAVEAFPQVAASDTLNPDPKVENVMPDPTQKVFTAQMPH